MHHTKKKLEFEERFIINMDETPLYCDIVPHKCEKHYLPVTQHQLSILITDSFCGYLIYKGKILNK